MYWHFVDVVWILLFSIALHPVSARETHEPSDLVLIGVTFIIDAAHLLPRAVVFGGHIDYAGLTMLLFLSVAMTLLFYVLLAGSPRGE